MNEEISPVENHALESEISQDPDTGVHPGTEEEEKSYKSKDTESKFPKKNPKYKKKVCKFCVDKEMEAGLDYKRVDILERFITNRGKIMPRRLTGTCAKHQRILAREIRKARYIGLLPYKVM